MKTHQKFLLLAVAALVQAAAFSQVAVQTPTGMPSIRELMSAKDLDRTGLDRLTDGEIAALDEWLHRYTAQLTKSALDFSSRVFGNADMAVETRIVGDFEGWQGGTTWEMDNGQVWQQTSRDNHHYYAFHPKVVIYRVAGGWKMKVEGDKEEVFVKRLK
ncbi:MAG: hypothetical protein HZC54_13270 [Verrucomicrobia bacterium]|nr:hypothetical protein [Verrucomicrobiota bacterium]